MAASPTDFASLQAMYFAEFAPLYDYLNVQLGHLPGELHFEIAAAFDHLMRAQRLIVEGHAYDIVGDVEKAAGHLKRGTFDAFKILLNRVIRVRCERLSRARYEDVDNGKFIDRVVALQHEAQTIGLKARQLERFGNRDEITQWTAAFEEWRKLRPIADELAGLEMSEGARRARRKYARGRILSLVVWIVSCVASGLVSILLARIF